VTIIVLVLDIKPELWSFGSWHCIVGRYMPTFWRNLLTQSSR